MLKRNKLAMLVAEFLGAGILTLVILTVQRSQLGLAYFVAIAAGLTVVGLTYAFGAISGAHMNPALTIALWTARRVRTLPALLFIVVQLLGAWAAYGLYHYFISGAAASATATTAAGAGNVQAITQAFDARIMVAEAIGTMIFALAWASAAYNKHETSKFAVVAGIGYILAIIVASAASVGLANPAVAVGVRAWEVFTGSNGWANYALGPVLGAIIGVNLYGLLFADPDGTTRLKGVFRRREAATVTSSSVSSRNTVVDEDLDDEDDDDEEVAVAEAPIDIDKAINENAKTPKVAPRSKVVVTKSKKSTAKKVAAKKKR